MLAELAGRRLNFIPALIGNLVPLPVPDWSKPIIVLLLLVILFMAARAWRSSRHTRRLESQRTELAADLESMQSALVPAIPEQLGALAFSVAYRPADGPAAGGDFYDAFGLEGGRVAVIVGDVSGHGRTALARAAHMHYTLRAYVETGLDPRASLKLAGRVLGNEGDGLFTTVAIAIYDPTSATLTYATAGHPAPVVLGEDVGDAVVRRRLPRPGLGAAHRPAADHAAVRRRRPCLLLQRRRHRGADGGRTARPRAPAASCSRRSARVSEPPSCSSVCGPTPTAVNDDMAACVIEAREGSSLLSRRVEELEANVEALAAGQGERFLHACGVAPRDVAAAVSALARWPTPMAPRSSESPAPPTGRLSAPRARPRSSSPRRRPLNGEQADAMAAAARSRAGGDAPAGQWAGRALPLRG